MSKRMQELSEKIDKTKVYTIEEAVALVKETSNVKFDASVEVHTNLGINPKKSDQQIRTTMTLPHGTGKTKKIAAFVGPNDEAEAKEAGADFIYGEEEIQKIKTSGKIEFEVAISTPEMMPKLAMVARVLGPRGLMPNPKTGTVGPNVKEMIADLKKGKVSFKNDDTSNIHQTIGKVSFDDTKIVENFNYFMETLKKVKPTSSKGTYIKSLYITSSMGPSIKVESPL
ncbi:MAG: 50S ribosomal protein L1 [Candidatus Magasanikbacteria bacterium]|nr:50S ribosomal protein L1 [Candidatus Magasanikbacteria bacterium]